MSKTKKINSRPGWDEYFLKISRLVSERSTCLRRKVGAVIVKDKRILATGYNGAPVNLPHCETSGCFRQKFKVPSGTHHEFCRALHAEMNAILQAAYYGVKITDAVLYATNQPCILCAKMIINSGIKKVIVSEGYPDEQAVNLFKEAKVELIYSRI